MLDVADRHDFAEHRCEEALVDEFDWPDPLFGDGMPLSLHNGRASPKSDLDILSEDAEFWRNKLTGIFLKSLSVYSQRSESGVIDFHAMMIRNLISASKSQMNEILTKFSDIRIIRHQIPLYDGGILIQINATEVDAVQVLISRLLETSGRA